VTNFNPLCVWIWNKPYIRFGAEDYDISDINNLYSHLTNNSIGKNSKNFYKSKIQENMWELHQFSSYLKVNQIKN
jgi:tubulin polyglutamylase TTLL2